MRPVPFWARSARKSTVRSPVMIQSGSWSPSPVPLIGSLLVTETILQDTGPLLSVALAFTVTERILWFGVCNTEGVAVGFVMTGFCESMINVAAANEG